MLDEQFIDVDGTKLNRKILEKKTINAMIKAKIEMNISDKVFTYAFSLALS